MIRPAPTAAARAAVIAIAAAAALAGSWAASPDVAWNGRVVDLDTAEPLAAVEILAEASGARATSRQDGTFEIRAVAPDRLRLSTSEHLPAALELREDMPGDLGTLALERGAVLAGRLVDAAGPVAGRLVVLQTSRGDGSDERRQVLTRADGGFRFGPLVSGPMRHAELIVAGAGRLLDLPTLPARTIDFGALRVPARVRVDGRVVTEGARAVAGALVGLLPLGLVGSADRPPREPAWTVAETDSDGRFSLEVAPEPHEVIVAERQHLPWSRRAVHVAGETDLGELRLSRGATLDGRVVDPDGTPVPGARIEIWDVRGPAFRTEWFFRERVAATADEAGRFRLGPLPPGADVVIRVQAEGFLADRRQLAVPEEPQAPEARFELRPAGRIIGKVVGASRRPVVGARIDTARAFDNLTGGGVRTAVRSDGDGRFELDVEPGEWSPSVGAAGHFSEEARDIEVLPGATSRVKVVLPPVAARLEVTELKLRLLSPDGVPLPGARLRVSRKGSGPRGLRLPAEVSTGADGVARFGGVPVGRYAVRLLDHRLVSPRPDRIRWLQPREPFDVIRDAETVTVRVRTEEAELVSVAGRVVDASGRPVAGANVVLETPELTAGVPRQLHAVSDSLGTFRFERVHRLPYRVHAFRPGHATGFGRDALEPGPDGLEGLQVTLPRGATVTGRIVASEPVEAERLSVRASPSLDAGPLERHGPSWVEPDGRFYILDVGPGAWTVGTSTDTEQYVSARVTVEPGATVVQSAPLVLPPSIRVAGRLRYRGEPLTEGNVTLWGPGSEHGLFDGVLDEAGRFEIRVPRAGSYRVSVRTPRVASLYSFPEPMRLEPDRPVELTVRAGAISGRVVDAGTGSPIGDARIRTQPPPAPVMMTHSWPQFLRLDSAGRFRMGKVSAGEWQLEVTAPGYAQRNVHVEVGDEDVDDVVIELQRSPGLHLRLQTGSGEAIEGAWLFWQPIGGGDVLDRLAFPEGDPDFHWQGVPLEDGVLTALGEARAARLHVDDDGRPVDVVLRPAAELRLEVAGLEGAPAEAVLRLFDADGIAVAARGIGGFSPDPPGPRLDPGAYGRHRGILAFPRAKDGRFRVRTLVPGRYRAVVEAADGRRWEGEVVVRPGRLTEAALPGNGTG